MFNFKRLRKLLPEINFCRAFSRFIFTHIAKNLTREIPVFCLDYNKCDMRNQVTASTT